MSVYFHFLRNSTLIHQLVGFELVAAAASVFLKLWDKETSILL